MVSTDAGALLSLREGEEDRAKVRGERSLDTHTRAKINSGNLFHNVIIKQIIFSLWKPYYNWILIEHH